MPGRRKNKKAKKQENEPSLAKTTRSDQDQGVDSSAQAAEPSSEQQAEPTLQTEEAKPTQEGQDSEVQSQDLEEEKEGDASNTDQLLDMGENTDQNQESEPQIISQIDARVDEPINHEAEQVEVLDASPVDGSPRESPRGIQEQPAEQELAENEQEGLAKQSEPVLDLDQDPEQEAKEKLYRELEQQYVAEENNMVAEGNDVIANNQNAETGEQNAQEVEMEMEKQDSVNLLQDQEYKQDSSDLLGMEQVDSVAPDNIEEVDKNETEANKNEENKNEEQQNLVAVDSQNHPAAIQQENSEKIEEPQAETLQEDAVDKVDGAESKMESMPPSTATPDSAIKQEQQESPQQTQVQKPVNPIINPMKPSSQETSQKIDSTAEESPVEVRPRKKKKKPVQQQNQPEAVKQEVPAQPQSSWSSFGLMANIGTGILSKAQQNLAPTIGSLKKNVEQVQEQYKETLKKKQQEEEWKKWQSDMAKEKEQKQKEETERAERERQQRLEAKRQRKLQREKERQLAAQQSAPQQDSPSKASNTESTSDVQPQQLKKTTSQISQEQQPAPGLKDVVDPLNPLAPGLKVKKEKSAIEPSPTPAAKKNNAAAPQVQADAAQRKFDVDKQQSPTKTDCSNDKNERTKDSSSLTTSKIQDLMNRQQAQTSEGSQEIASKLLPPPENSDMASSVSLNTEGLYDNLESISQIGASDQMSDSGTLDLQNIGAELSKRDKKIKDLLDDRARLKNLLKKAKTAMDSINSKYKTTQEENINNQQKGKALEARLHQALEKNKDLVQTLEIIQKQRNGIDRSEVKQILARIRCNDTSYTLIELKNLECIWYPDTLILNIQEHMSESFKEAKQVAYPGVFQQQEQTEKNLQQCMQQYEERLKRVNEYMEQSNTAYLKCQEELQQCRRKYAQELQERDNALTLLIEKSIDLKSIVMSIDEKASNQMLSVGSQAQLAAQGKKSLNKHRKTANIADLIQDLEMQITGMMNISANKSPSSSANDQNVVEIRNHLIDLYQRIGVGLLKKHQQYVERLQTTESEWQDTCDQLINEVQSMKEDREQEEVQVHEQLRTKTEQLNQLKTDHYNVVKANEENTEKLKTEINNSLNAHYLKNILSSYFTTTDATVQINLLKVVFNVMKYSDEEQKRILDIWNENNKSTLQRMFEFGM